MSPGASQLLNEYTDCMALWQRSADDETRDFFALMGSEALVRIFDLPEEEFLEVMQEIRRGA